MILSFHPCYVADENRLVAGRDPDDEDRVALRRADAVILPQGCRQRLYEMARTHCSRVFPNYDARFAYPGKIGQSRLFRTIGVRFPETDVYAGMTDFDAVPPEKRLEHNGFPVVFKLNWGGEGQTVWRVDDAPRLQQLLERAAEYEASGMPGFLIQSYIPTAGLSLRVAVIGRSASAYWRQAPTPTAMGGLSGGGKIIRDLHPQRMARAVAATRDFCRQTGINLAGFDFIFDTEKDRPDPMFLEINYFFGRRGLGGSNAFYELLAGEIDRWLAAGGVS